MGKSYVEKLVALKLLALSLSNTSPKFFSYQIYIDLSQYLIIVYFLIAVRQEVNI